MCKYMAFVLGNALILVIGKNSHNFSKEIDLIVKEKYVDFPQVLSVLKKTLKQHISILNN